MASIYTYDQFQQEAQNSGLLGKFSDADLNLAKINPDAGMSILKYKQDYANATTDEARALANAGAESIRSSYGNYTGGGDGGSFHLNQVSPSSFAPETAPTYENQYEQQEQQLMDAILNREQFSYDASTDPSYSQYRKQYAREGDRATQDALGAAAAASGGIPSSYAVTAASQAGDYYAAQMADKIPELYQQAYQRYLNEYNMKLSDLGMVQDAEQMDYNKFLNELNQYNTDRQFDYGQYLDEIDSQTRERQEALEKAELAAEMGDYSFLNDMGIDTSNNSTDYDRQYQLALLKAQYGDYSGLRALGVNIGGSSGSSGSGGSTGNKKSSPIADSTEKPVEDVKGVDMGVAGQLLSKYPNGVIPSNDVEILKLRYGTTLNDLKDCGFTIKSTIR